MTRASETESIGGESNRMKSTTLQNLDQIRHPLRPQQLGRVGRNGPRVDQIKIGYPRASDEIPDLPG